MLRHPIPQTYLWIALWLIVALLLLLLEGILVPQPVMTIAGHLKGLLDTFLIQLMHFVR